MSEWEGEHVLLDAACRNAVADGHGKQVDQFFRTVPNHLGADDPVGGVIHDDLRKRDRFSVALGGEPTRHVACRDPDIQPRVLGRLGHTDRGEAEPCARRWERRRIRGCGGPSTMLWPTIRLGGGQRRQLRGRRQRIARDPNRRSETERRNSSVSILCPS